MKPHRTIRGALLAAALLAGSPLISIAGDGAAGKKVVLEPKPPANPLCFLDGRLCFDLEERFRWEIRDNNFDFNDAVNVPTDDNWFLQRARIGMKLAVADWLKVYVQAQDSREINSDRADFPGLLAAEGDDSFDLRQAWVEFGDVKAFPLTLKLGRQVLSYGDERVIGAFDWNNIGRTFDAAKLRWEEKTWSLDAFAASVVVPERASYNQSDFYNGTESDRQQIFSGLYFSTTAIPVQTTDLYVLHLHENNGPDYQSNPLGDTNFFTFGARVKSKPGAFAPREDTALSKDGKTAVAPKPPKPVGFDYDGEFAFQTGNVRGMDLTAFAVHAGAGYTFDASWLPRLGVAYNFGTGDDDPADREIQTFQNLFPTNHKFYGQMDVFSWQNIHDLEFSVKVQPLKAVTIKAEYHAFWLETTDDAWYRANGVATVRPLNAAARAAGNYGGSEADLTVTWNVNKWLQVEAGYSHFFAGDYLADTGPSDDADFGYVQVKMTF
ncbi:MAG: alginate export family protein [Chthoniobacteraceae bacterium]